MRPTTRIISRWRTTIWSSRVLWNTACHKEVIRNHQLTMVSQNCNQANKNLFKKNFASKSINSPVRARFVRLLPTEWHVRISLCLEVLSCDGNYCLINEFAKSRTRIHHTYVPCAIPHYRVIRHCLVRMTLKYAERRFPGLISQHFPLTLDVSSFNLRWSHYAYGSLPLCGGSIFVVITYGFKPSLQQRIYRTLGIDIHKNCPY